MPGDTLVLISHSTQGYWIDHHLSVSEWPSWEWNLSTHTLPRLPKYLTWSPCYYINHCLKFTEMATATSFRVSQFIPLNIYQSLSDRNVFGLPVQYITSFLQAILNCLISRFNGTMSVLGPLDSKVTHSPISRLRGWNSAQCNPLSFCLFCRFAIQIAFFIYSILPYSSLQKWSTVSK